MTKPTLLEQVSNMARLKHFSIRTEQTYLYWIKRFILFHNKRHPSAMGEREIREFISDLTIRENLAPSSQDTALSAVLFLYRKVLDKPLTYIEGVEQSKRPAKLPLVFSREEVKVILAQLTGGRVLDGRITKIHRMLPTSGGDECERDGARKGSNSFLSTVSQGGTVKQIRAQKCKDLRHKAVVKMEKICADFVQI